MKSPALAVFVVTLAAALVARAQSPENIGVERSRIAAERGAAEARFAQAAAGCYQKFAVNQCVAAAKAQRREKLSELRRQDLLLADAQRKQRGDERARVLQEKASARKQEPASPERTRAAGEQKVRDQRAEQKAADRPPLVEAQKARAAQQQDKIRQKNAANAAQRSDRTLKAAEARSKAQARQKDWDERKARVEKNIAEPKKPEVKPLPVPP